MNPPPIRLSRALEGDDVGGVGWMQLLLGPSSLALAPRLHHMFISPSDPSVNQLLSSNERGALEVMTRRAKPNTQQHVSTSRRSASHAKLVTLVPSHQNTVVLSADDCDTNDHGNRHQDAPLVQIRDKDEQVMEVEEEEEEVEEEEGDFAPPPSKKRKQQKRQPPKYTKYALVTKESTSVSAGASAAPACHEVILIEESPVKQAALPKNDDNGNKDNLVASPNGGSPSHLSPSLAPVRLAFQSSEEASEHDLAGGGGDDDEFNSSPLIYVGGFSQLSPALTQPYWDKEGNPEPRYSSPIQAGDACTNRSNQLHLQLDIDSSSDSGSGGDIADESGARPSSTVISTNIKPRPLILETSKPAVPRHIGAFADPSQPWRAPVQRRAESTHVNETAIDAPAYHNIDDSYAGDYGSDGLADDDFQARPLPAAASEARQSYINPSNPTRQPCEISVESDDDFM